MAHWEELSTFIKKQPAIMQNSEGDLMETIIDKAGLDRLNHPQKKEFLGNLVASLLQDLTGKEKKDLLQKIVTYGDDNPPVIDMVEH